jgi:uncharacterized membrane protein YkoI
LTHYNEAIRTNTALFKRRKEIMSKNIKIGILVMGILVVVAVAAFASTQVGADVNANNAIGLDKGVNVALQDAGFESEEVTNLTAHYDNDDGVATYEVNFVANGFEYEYQIKAADGAIIEATRETAEVPVIKGSEIKFEDPAPQVQNEPAEVQEPVQNEPAKQPLQEQKPAEPASKYIGVDKAKSIALSDAGVKSSEATFTKAKLDKDDGVAVYEIDFYSNGTEYEYEISATSGNIRDKDWDNAWD